MRGLPILTLATFFVVLCAGVTLAEEDLFRPCSGAEVKSLVAKVNVIRQSRLLGDLSTHPALTRAAMARAKYIATTQRLSHDDWYQAISENGYESLPVAENIANGHKNSSSVISGWFNSDGHRRNMLNPNYRYVGHGCVIDREGRRWWTQLLGG